MSLKKQTLISFFLILCVMGFFAILSSTMSKNPVLNPFAKSLLTPTDLLGFVASASTIPGMLISLPAASLSDIFGRRKVLLFAAFVFASAPFLYLLVTVWWQLVLVRFYHGFATAIFIPVTEAIIAERFPTKRGERISILESATAIGRASAPFLGGAILFLTNDGFHTLYLAVGIAGVIAFIVTLLFITEEKNPEAKQPKNQQTASNIFHGWHEIAKNKGALVTGMVQASQYYVYGAVEFFLVGYLLEVAKLNLILISIITGSQIIILIIGRPFLGRISDKTGRRTPIITGSIISAITLLAFPFTTQFSILLLLSIVYGLGFAMVISSTSPLICEQVPSTLVGSSLGFLATTMDIGQTVGPVISGIILSSILHYNAMFYSLSALLISSCLIFNFSKIAKNQVTSENKTQTT